MELLKKRFLRLALIALIGVSFSAIQGSEIAGGLENLIKALQDLIAVKEPIPLSEFPVLEKIAIAPPVKLVFDEVKLTKASIVALGQAFILGGYWKVGGQETLVKLRFATVLIPEELEVLDKAIDEVMAAKEGMPSYDELPDDEFGSKSLVVKWSDALAAKQLDLVRIKLGTLETVKTYLTNLNNPAYTTLLALIDQAIADRQTFYEVEPTSVDGDITATTTVG